MTGRILEGAIYTFVVLEIVHGVGYYQLVMFQTTNVEEMSPSWKWSSIVNRTFMNTFQCKNVNLLCILLENERSRISNFVHFKRKLVKCWSPIYLSCPLSCNRYLPIQFEAWITPFFGCLYMWISLLPRYRSRNYTRLTIHLARSSKLLHPKRDHLQ